MFLSLSTIVNVLFFSHIFFLTQFIYYSLSCREYPNPRIKDLYKKLEKWGKTDKGKEWNGRKKIVILSVYKNQK